MLKLISQWSLRRHWRNKQQCFRRYCRLCLALPHYFQFRQPCPLVLPRRSPDLLDAKQRSTRLEHGQPDHGRIRHLGRCHRLDGYWLQVLCGLHAPCHYPILPLLAM